MKIRVEVPIKIHDILTSSTPQKIIDGLQDITKLCEGRGFEELEIVWVGYDYQTAYLYGIREENESERITREKREEKIKQKEEKTKQKAIENAKNVLKKYGEKI